MAVVRMQRAALVVHKKSLPPVLARLQEHGIFDVSLPIDFEKSSLSYPEEVFSGIESKLANLRFVIRYLTPFAKKPTRFREKFLGEKVESNEQVTLECGSRDFSELIQKCVTLEERENKAKADLLRIAEREKAFSGWGDFDLPLHLSERIASTGIRIGNVDAKDADDFEEKISKEPLCFVQRVSTSPKRVSFVFFFHKSVSETYEEVLREYRFEDMDFGEIIQTVREEFEKMKAMTEELSEKLVSAKREKELLAEELSEIKLAYDALSWEKEQKDVLNKAYCTKESVVLFGWIPEKKFESVRQSILRSEPSADLLKIGKEDGDSPPTELQNKNFIRPFESIVSLFGAPAYSELDPTPYLAPFFVIFFGFCLTDAGYGALMLISLLSAFFLLPLDRSTRDMVRLLIFASISTIILGVIFGGYFGMTYEQLPWFVNPETKYFYGQIFNPVDDMIPFVMAFAYGLGILHLFLGVILSGVNRWKNGKKGDALFASGSLGLIVICALLSAFPSFRSVTPGIIGVLSLFLVWRIGVLDFINEMLSWLSNILSYSRLFALGLATGIIALAFNSIALTLGGMMPLAIGIPVALLILLFGHTLNMALNILGAFVHSARLQFVEFFGKFLEGGGKTFQPLSRKCVYLFDSQR
ncbi:V-type ATP synthase subunit I [Candidatus Peregrinibacteria bacterium]|nr:MAG: V-type ATP synthase subunit I [Candidatus Peregrinibacteria bacterium]